MKRETRSNIWPICLIPRSRKRMRNKPSWVWGNEPKAVFWLSACMIRCLFDWQLVSIRPVCRQGRPPPEPEPHAPLRLPPAHTQLFVISEDLVILETWKTALCMSTWFVELQHKNSIAMMSQLKSILIYDHSDIHLFSSEGQFELEQECKMC